MSEAEFGVDQRRSEQTFAENTARIEAEERAREAAELAALEVEGGEEWGEEEWGEGGEEEVAFHRGEGRQSTPLVEEGLFTASEAETTGSDSGATRTCVEHSNAAGHPCVRFVKSIFDEIISGIHHGISTAGHWGSALYHKAVRVVNWPREKGCEYYAHIKCNIGNTASSCELETFTLYASSFIPETDALKGLLVGAGTINLARC